MDGENRADSRVDFELSARWLKGCELNANSDASKSFARYTM